MTPLTAMMLESRTGTNRAGIKQRSGELDDICRTGKTLVRYGSKRLEGERLVRSLHPISNQQDRSFNKMPRDRYGGCVWREADKEVSHSER